MTRLVNSIYLAFSLLACATTASAECAWVLWTETEAISPDQLSDNWKSVSFDRNVHATRKACDVELVQWIELQAQVARDTGIQVVRRGDGQDSSDYKDHYLIVDPLLRRVTEVFRDKRSVIVKEYNCLPDTVDPRGPKGKWRSAQST